MMSSIHFKKAILLTSLLSLFCVESSFAIVDVDGDGLIDISTLSQLDAVRNNPAGTGLTLIAGDPTDSTGCFGIADGSTDCNGYELINDLDFDTNSDGVIDANDTYWNGGLGWEPLPFNTGVFRRNFNGNNYQIINLYINRPAATNIGLFGFVSGADLVNIILAGPLMSVTGGSIFTGGLVGQMSNVTITNSHVSGNITGEDRVGGLVGNAQSSTIEFSSSDATINADERVGGLFGQIQNSTIISSYAENNIIAMRTVGGLIGYSENNNISVSYSAGDISGSIWVGGLIGYSRYDSIKNAYSQTIVNAASTVGGLVGLYLTDSSTELINSYSSSVINLGTGGNSVNGGLIGFDIFDNGVTIQGSHWDITTSGLTNVIYDEVNDTNLTLINTLGLTTTESQCPLAADNTTCKPGSTLYVNWDPAIWDFGTSTDYPSLAVLNDFDNDGIVNGIDPDDDNDSFSDLDETTCGSDPLSNTSLPIDSDNDGLCDNGIDEDDDNDGVLDGDDAFPLDPDESLDTDLDGIGNNADTDDDADQMEDTWESFYGLDPLVSDASLDTDGDGFSNLAEYLNGTDPTVSNAINQENTSLTRAALAKQLLIRKYGPAFLPDAATGTVFTDVSIGDFNAAWIERLAIDAITLGCTALTYCPDQVVTKEQLAILILKTNNGSAYTPPPATGSVFADVAADDFAADWIEALSALGGTMGCDASNYCPDEVVSQEGLQILLNNIIF